MRRNPELQHAHGVRDNLVRFPPLYLSGLRITVWCRPMGNDRRAELCADDRECESERCNHIPAKIRSVMRASLSTAPRRRPKGRTIAGPHWNAKMKLTVAPAAKRGRARARVKGGEWRGAD